MTGTSNKIKPKNKFFKLVKNDFLASARLISLCYVALALVLLVGTITTNIIRGGSLEGDMLTKAYTVRNVAILISEFGSLVLVFATVFFVIYDFFKSLYSPQGYLSFTLPVSSNQLLGSKVLVYGGWLVLSFLSVFFLTAYWGQFAMNEYGEEISLAESLATTMGIIPSLSQLVAQIAIIAAGVAVYIISIVFLIYFSITLSHVRIFQKHSLIVSVLIFLVSFIVFFAVAGKASEIVNLSVIFIPEKEKIVFDILKEGEAFKDNLVAVCISDVVASIILDVGIFFGTSYIMHKKVNIK